MFTDEEKDIPQGLKPAALLMLLRHATQRVLRVVP